jgi:hypothetical protein
MFFRAFRKSRREAHYVENGYDEKPAHVRAKSLLSDVDDLSLDFCMRAASLVIPMLSAYCASIKCKATRL